MHMKTISFFIPLLGIALSIGSCEEKERVYEDSPLITVKSPARNQYIEDTDSVRVQAVIENKNALLKKCICLVDRQSQTIHIQPAMVL